jgi:hypothetical protein
MRFFGYIMRLIDEDGADDISGSLRVSAWHRLVAGAKTLLPGRNMLLAAMLPAAMLLSMMNAASGQVRSSTAASTRQPPVSDESISDESIMPADAQWHFRFDLFQMLLEEQGVELAGSMDFVMNRPESSSVVLIGDLSRTTRDEWLRILRFVAQGGIVFVASDQSCVMNGIGTFHSGPVTATRSADRYQGFADCVRIGDLNRGHTMVSGVDEIICNRSGWFKPQPGGSLSWDRLAALPPACRPTAGRSQLLAAVGKLSPQDKGMVIVAADQSILSNNMLWHGDNAVLAIRAAETLCHDRQQVLFLTDGRILTGFRHQQADTKLPRKPAGMPPIPDEVPEPELETMLRVANAVIRNVEESNIVNETLMEQPRYVRQPLYMRVVLLLLFLAAVFWIIWKLMNQAAITTSPVPVRPMQTASRMRRMQNVEHREFGPALEILARDFCRDLTGSELASEWQKQLTGSGAKAVSQRLTRSQRKTLSDLLLLAVHGCRVHISRRRFQYLGRSIQELRTLYSSELQSVGI